MNKKEMNNKGFSLVELIIVIAIMAILVGVLAPQFIKYVESSKKSTDIQNASEIRAAVEAFVAENQPTTNITIKTDGSNIKVAGGAWKDSAGADKTVTDALTAVGLSDTTPCKSVGWGSKDVATYDVTTFKWGSFAADGKNSKEPKKDITSAFK